MNLNDSFTLNSISGNGLQVWDVADASGLSSIGKIDFFRENQSSGYWKKGYVLYLLLSLRSTNHRLLNLEKTTAEKPINAKIRFSEHFTANMNLSSGIDR